MKGYLVTGRFEMGWIDDQGFIMEVAAPSQEKAKEQIMSELGSKHKVKRRQIKIEKVEEIPLAKIQSQIVKKMIGDAK